MELISNRGTDNPVANQMPPIATLIVDTTDTDSVVDWIAKMPKPPSDAGAEAGTMHDAGPDATVGEEGGLDAAPGNEASADAGVDATLDDAGDAADAAMDDDADDGDGGSDAGSSTATED